MRLKILFVVLAAALPVYAVRPVSSGPRQEGGAEQEVRKLERAWLDAYEKNDAKAMDAIVADDFTITFPDGSMQTKPQIMEMIKRPRNPAAPPAKFYTEDVRSRAYGDTVILLGRVVTEYVRDGKPVKEASRYTDTYVKRGGRWQVVASHLSNDGRPQAQPSPAP
ncbi:MAG TPA: nuclear transport factor 2 family protein [Pyrinomonadaceae bacterium]|nr:nuclear transport factor 2 family protein [Pyrinomonadaceae bacterium]